MTGDTKRAHREIRIELVKRGITGKQVAAGVGMAYGYYRNIINGSNECAKGRARIETFLGQTFWPKSKNKKR